MQNLEKGALALRKAIEQIQSKLASPAFIEGLRDQEFWFDNLVENGTFDLSTTGWIALNGAAISVASGKLRVGSGASGYGTAAIQIKCEVGRTYLMRWSPSTVGTLYATRAGVDVDTLLTSPHTAVSAAGAVTGEQTLEFTATATTHYVFLQVFTGTASVEMDFDNVSVFPTDGTEIIHRMPTGWKPRRVFVDGNLQREGATHDYEIKQDPEGYYIVPAVAPGANTETCILGVKA